MGDVATKRPEVSNLWIGNQFGSISENWILLFDDIRIFQFYFSGKSSDFQSSVFFLYVRQPRYFIYVNQVRWLRSYVAPDGARTPGRYVTVWTRDYEGHWRYAFDGGLD